MNLYYPDKECFDAIFKDPLLSKNYINIGIKWVNGVKAENYEEAGFEVRLSMSYPHPKFDYTVTMYGVVKISLSEIEDWDENLWGEVIDKMILGIKDSIKELEEKFK